MTTIIGYTNELETPAVPRILDPVYFVSDQYELMPVHEAGVKELEHMLNLTVTYLKYPIKVKKGHDLWINQEGAINYTPHEVTKKIFGLTYERCLEIAEEKLSVSDLKATKRFATIAGSIKYRAVEPLLLRAVSEFFLLDIQGLAMTLCKGTSVVCPHVFSRRFNELLVKYPHLEINDSL